MDGWAGALVPVRTSRHGYFLKLNCSKKRLNSYLNDSAIWQYIGNWISVITGSGKSAKKPFNTEAQS